MKEIFDFISRGGFIMIPIGIGSIIAVTIFLERLWALRKSVISPDGLAESVTREVQKNNLKKARDLCLMSNTSLGRILLSGLDIKNAGRSNVKNILEESGKRETAKMEKFVEALGTTAGIEPLLGLLGTVIGMIRVFQKVVLTSKQGSVDPGVLANGIWQALITTAAGLSVAIIAFIGYRHLLSRISEGTAKLEEGSIKLLNALYPLDSSQKSEAE